MKTIDKLVRALQKLHEIEDILNDVEYCKHEFSKHNIDKLRNELMIMRVTVKQLIDKES